MSNLLGERVRKIRKEKNKKAIDVSRAVGVTQAAISLIESGDREPSIDLLKKLADYFEVNVGYFFGVDEGKETFYKSLLNVIRVPIYSGMRFPSDHENILGFQDLFIDYINCTNKSYSDYFGLRVDTRSMEPKIAMGDVLIMATDEIKTNDVVAVFVNKTDYGLYNYRETPEGIVLMPNNLSFSPRLFKGKEDMKSEGVQIVGKVIHQFRSY